MIVHNLLNVIVGYGVFDDARCRTTRMRQVITIGEIVVPKLGPYTIANVIALQRQKRYVIVDQVAVYDRCVPEAFVVFLFIYIFFF